jgi:protein-tyrosine phosphatase
MIGILFVCMGNICRSPMAEGVFQHKVNQAGLSQFIRVDSAGTWDGHEGEPASAGTLRLLRQHGIPYDGRSRPLTARDLDEFDYVLAMDRQNLAFIQRLVPTPKADVRLFLSFAREAGLVTVDEVPDPYYDNTYERVYSLVTAGSQALLDHLRERYRLDGGAG